MPRSTDAKQALSADQEGPSDAARPEADAELGRERDEKLGPQLPDLPLIPGESESEYRELVAGLETTLRPRDFIEAVHCRNIADVIWEEHRLRRSKHSLLIDDRRRAMRDYLTGLLTSRPGLIGSEEPDLMARGWIIGDPEALTTLERVFSVSDETVEVVIAQAVRDNLHIIDQIDRMIMILTMRRDKLLDEYDRRRLTPSGTSRNNGRFNSDYYNTTSYLQIPRFPPAE
jgi:hypothetical protein